MSSADHSPTVTALPMLGSCSARQCGPRQADQPVGNGASEDPSGDIGRLQARRGAEAKPALFQGSDSWKGSQMQSKTKKKLAASFAAGAVAVAGAGVAFAYWTSSG